MVSERIHQLAAVAADLRAHLQWLRDAGVRELPAPPVMAPPRASTTAASTPEASRGLGGSLRAAVHAAVGQRAPEAPAAPPPAPAPLIAAAEVPAAPGCEPVAAPRAQASAVTWNLEGVRRKLGDCQRCKLGGQRTNLVFGAGNPRAELIFVGEAPGEEEDRQGEPFVGKAGQLLGKMIEAMGFARDEVYLCTVVKCRPPAERAPEPEEIAACEAILRAQLATFQPKVIVCLGKVAAQTLLREQTPISKLRGVWTEVGGVPVMPTYHPAYLLRNPNEKRTVWDDLKQVMKRLGKEPSSR